MGSFLNKPMFREGEIPTQRWPFVPHLRQQSWIGVHGFTPDLRAGALLHRISDPKHWALEWALKPRVQICRENLYSLDWGVKKHR